MPRTRTTAAALLAVAAALVVAAIVALTTVGNGSAHRQAARHVAPRDTRAAGKASAPAVPGTTRQVTRPLPALQPVGNVTQHKPSSITYVVRPGDNLTVIAAWFKLHGYGDLYARNKAVIGADPNLIRPGQKITVTPAGASVHG